MGCLNSKEAGENPKPPKEAEPREAQNGHKGEAKRGGDKSKPKPNGDGGSDDNQNDEKANPISPGDVEDFYKFGKEIGKYVPLTFSPVPRFSI